ncbi:GDSL-type esterase/lipase family protein [Arthrobacter sp. D2-10]
MADEDSQGIVKIDAARSAILQQTQELPVSTRLGLMTYPAGSSNERGCQSGHLQLPVSSSSATNVGTTLTTLPEPDGDTPTSDAMLEGADYLKSEGSSQATIVLVSDGESNCGDDPCETAKKLKAENINVTVNTVGFDISASGAAELECVAAASGGVYVTARDASELAEALKSQLGNGLGVSVTAPATPVPMYEQTFDVMVTVSVAPGHRASNVIVQVRDTDTSSGSSVHRPIMMLGNLGSGTKITTRWLIRPPTNPELDESTYSVSVTAEGSAPITENFRVSYTHDLPTGANLSGSLRNFKNIVVLGDSYSSGEGASNAARPYFQVADQSPACHRTKNQYANWLYSPEQVRVLACSGAVSLNIYNSGQHGEPSQLDQLRKMLATGYRPDAIFLTITGNDIGFGDIANACAKSALVDRAVTERSPLANCPASEVSGEAHTAVLDLVESVPAYLMTVLVRTSWVFEDLGIETPPIIVLKYPQMLAVDEGLPLRCSGRHGFQMAALGAAFKSFSALQDKLNENIDEGATLAREEGVTSVHVAETGQAIPAAHNLCSSDPWFVPVTANDAAAGSPEMLHPNIAGHQAIAAKLNSWAASPEAADLVPATSSTGADPWWKKATIQWWPTESEVTVPLSQPIGVGKIGYGTNVIHVTGGDPLTGVTIYVKSEPRVLGSVTLNEKGEATLTVNLQATELPPGNHTVNAMGTIEGRPVVASVPVTLAQPFPLAFWIIGTISVVMLVSAWRLLARKVGGART